MLRKLAKAMDIPMIDSKPSKQSQLDPFVSCVTMTSLVG